MRVPWPAGSQLNWPARSQLNWPAGSSRLNWPAGSRLNWPARSQLNWPAGCFWSVFLLERAGGLAIELAGGLVFCLKGLVGCFSDDQTDRLSVDLWRLPSEAPRDVFGCGLSDALRDETGKDMCGNSPTVFMWGGPHPCPDYYIKLCRLWWRLCRLGTLV